MRRQEKKQEIRKESRKRRNSRHNQKRAIQRSFKGFKHMLRKLWNETHPTKKGKRKEETPSSPRKKEEKTYILPTSKPLQPGSIQGFYKTQQAAPAARRLEAPAPSFNSPHAAFRKFLDATPDFIKDLLAKNQHQDLCGSYQLTETAPEAPTVSQGVPQSEILLGCDKELNQYQFCSEQEALDKNAVSFVRFDITFNSDNREKAYGQIPFALMEASEGRRVIVANVYLDPKESKEIKRSPTKEARTIYKMPIKDQKTGKKLIKDISYDPGSKKDEDFKQERRDLVYYLIKNCKDVEYAYVNAGCVTVVFIKKEATDQPGWLKLIQKNLGVTVGSGAKVVKRISQLNRGYFATLTINPEELNIILLDGSTKLSKEDEEKALDGMIPMSADLFDRLKNYQKDEELKDLMEKAQSSDQFNFRCLLPKGIKLLLTNKKSKLLEKGCKAKGQAARSTALPAMTIALHSCNLKKELEVDEHQPVRIYADPQPGHDESYMASQYLLCQQHVFDHKEVGQLFEKGLERKLSMLAEGKYEREDQLKDMLWWKVLEHTYQVDIRLCAAQWAEKGDLRSMPHLAKLAWTFGMERLVIPEEGKVTVRIPFAVHWQVISRTMAQWLSAEDLPDYGPGVTFWEERKLVVVDDLNYIKMLPDHGGSDQDDFFDAVVRFVVNPEDYSDVKLKIFLFRSPNDIGEYSVHDLQGELPLGWGKRLNQIPAIDGPTTARPWPKRRSDNAEAVEKIKHKFSKPKSDGLPWSLEKFKVSINSPMGNAGIGINAWMGYLSSLIHNHGWYEVCQMNPIPKIGMEDMIDQNTQVCDPEAIELCTQYAAELADLLDTLCPEICQTFWDKGLQFNYEPEDRGVVYATRVRPSSLTDLLSKCRKKLDETIKKIQDIFNEQAPAHVLQVFHTPEVFPSHGMRQEFKKHFDVWANRKKDRPLGVLARVWEETTAKKALEHCLAQNRPLFGKGTFEFGRFIYLFQNDPENRKYEAWMNWLYSPSIWSEFFKWMEDRKAWTDFLEPSKVGFYIQKKKVPQEPTQEVEPMMTMTKKAPQKPQEVVILTKVAIPPTKEEIVAPTASQSLERGGFKLNDQQEAAYKVMEDFVKGDSKYLLLSGYAGTGKTLLTTLFLQEYCRKNRFHSVLSTAPTHKAVSVAQKKAKEWSKNFSCLKFCTTHSALSIKAEMTETEMKFVEDRYGINAILSSQLCVVDEASMLNEELFKILKKSVSRSKCKVIFLGDPCQLPPVHETQSPVFHDPEVKVINLTKVMRQAGDNPAAFLIDEFRNNVLNSTPLDFNQFKSNWQGKDEDGRGVQFMDATKVIEYSVKKFMTTKDPDDLRLLAWTNNTVKRLNTQVRQGIYGPEVTEFTCGENLVMDDTYKTDMHDLENGYPVRVEQATLVEEEVVVSYLNQRKELVNESIGVWPIWKLKIFHEEGTDVIPVLPSKMKGKDSPFSQLLSRIAVRAKVAKVRGDSSVWKLYWAVKKLFAEVRYCYAETVHKSQGSTYEEVVTFLGDITKNSNQQEALQCAYVAVSRASQTITVPYLP